MSHNDQDPNEERDHDTPRARPQGRAAALLAKKEKQKALAKAYRERLKQSPAYQARLAAAKDKAKAARRHAYEQQKEKRRAAKEALKNEQQQLQQEAKAAKDDSLRQSLLPASQLAAPQQNTNQSRTRQAKKTKEPAIAKTPPPSPQASQETRAQSLQDNSRAIDNALLEKLGELGLRRGHLSLVKGGSDAKT